VQVHHDEGVASHIGPEPCAVPPRGCLRSVGRGVRRPAIEPRKGFIPGADAVLKVEGNMSGRVNASARTARRGLRPWHVQTLLAREPGDLRTGQRDSLARVRTGKARSRSQ
jgi:hypothetical protein